jgi:hypothetical protein
MYYIDTTSFSSATAVYTDELLTVKAPDGYYKFGSVYREQLAGVLLNNIPCTSCIDCKEFVSFTYKTGVSSPDDTIQIWITYTDCWGYQKTLPTITAPSTGGQPSTILLSDYDLGGKCVKNGSVQTSSLGFFYVDYGDNPECSLAEGLVQSQLCTVGGVGSPTPTGCSISCTVVDSNSNAYIPYSSSIYLVNGDIVYASNNTGDPYVGGDLYYKINHNNITYGVRISDLGVISELTYCNP